MTIELLTPILEGGIRHNHFFEGRLLTARDLRDEQEAQRHKRRQLGRALGAGVVEGLWVQVEDAATASGSPVLRVSPGLAVNGYGQSMELPSQALVILARPQSPTEPGPRVFDNCDVLSATVVPSGTGLYLLVMSPASGFAERAPQSGLGSEGKATGCGRRYEVEGVQFRIEAVRLSDFSGISPETRTRLDAELTGAASPAHLSLLRNISAHLFFGTERLAELARDPFAREGDGTSSFLHYGARDNLRELQVLTDCDVPLALFHWTQQGIAFLDCWAVRRRPVEIHPQSCEWPQFAGDRRTGEGEAMLLQFQQHLDDLVRDHPNPSAIVGRHHFQYLPPAGLLPIQGTGRTQGLSAPSFFQGKTHRQPVFMDGARLLMLFHHSMLFPPVDMRNEEMVRLYSLRQNHQPLTGESAVPGPPVIIYTTGHMGFFGEPRFDVSYWNYSNYL